MKDTIVTTSWDDGHVLDKKMAKLMKKYGIKGTFFISPRDREFDASKLLTPQEVVQLAQDFEIGAHTITHPHLTAIPLDEARKEIEDSKRYLEELLGSPVAGFCYPAGKFGREHSTIVQNAGFRYARTVDRFSFTITKSEPYTIATSLHAYDHWLDVWNLLTFVRFNPFRFIKTYRRWDEQAILMFEHVRKHGGVFHLWGHSWEVDAHQDWDRLERVLKHISGHSGVRYLTNEEVLQYA